MKKIILFSLFASIAFNGFGKTWTVVSSGMTFSPATVTINQGDSVLFDIDSSHNAVEVSQTTWNANGFTSNNGFSISFGGGTALPAKLTIGTHYYVCSPHVSFGMKGKVIVQAATGLSETKTENNLTIYPNPISDRINIQLDMTKSTAVEIQLYDIQGRLVSTLLPKTTVDGPFQQSYNRSAEMLPGVYLIKMDLGNTTSYRKVIAL